ncbi:MAG: hypothetical protein NUV94_05355 [Candidatus Acetothermia bacterium]|jgi:hypothetical protein|nr:hypothetical protein [Candidatus Acetothermia bacterium]
MLRIYEAAMEHGSTLSEIGRTLGLHSAVGKIVRRRKGQTQL